MRILVALVCLGIYAATPLDLHTQLAVAVGTFLLAILVGRGKGELSRLALVAISIAATARYLWWRFSTTLADQWPLDAARRLPARVPLREMRLGGLRGLRAVLALDDFAGQRHLRGLRVPGP